MTIQSSTFNPIRPHLEDHRQLPLTHQEIPAPFAAQALRWGANLNLLNPPNKGQSKISKYLGKPLRMLARLVYSITVPALCALAGVPYHLTSMVVNVAKAALNYKNQSLKAFYKTRAFGHFSSAVIDLISWVPITALRFAGDSGMIARFIAYTYYDTKISKAYQDSIFLELNAKSVYA